MEKTTISQVGSVVKGGLALPMEEVNDFFSKWPGKRILASFTVLGDNASEAIKTYYHKAVVPQIRQALYMHEGARKTDKQVEEWLREISPVAYTESYNEITDSYEHNVLEINDMTNRQLSKHIEFIKDMAAEQYQVFVEDPKSF